MVSTDVRVRMFETSNRPHVIGANEANPQYQIQSDLRWIISRAVAMTVEQWTVTIRKCRVVLQPEAV